MGASVSPEQSRPMRSAHHRRWPSLTPANIYRCGFGAPRQSEHSEAVLRAFEAGRQELNELEQQLKADPDYAYKRAILLPILQPLLLKLHPSEWADVFAASYARLEITRDDVAHAQ